LEFVNVIEFVPEPVESPPTVMNWLLVRYPRMLCSVVIEHIDNTLDASTQGTELATGSSAIHAVPDPEIRALLTGASPDGVFVLLLTTRLFAAGHVTLPLAPPDAFNVVPVRVRFVPSVIARRFPKVSVPSNGAVVRAGKFTVPVSVGPDRVSPAIVPTVPLAKFIGVDPRVNACAWT
jgi:hypothetical protein